VSAGPAERGSAPVKDLLTAHLGPSLCPCSRMRLSPVQYNTAAYCPGAGPSTALTEAQTRADTEREHIFPSHRNVLRLWKYVYRAIGPVSLWRKSLLKCIVRSRLLFLPSPPPTSLHLIQFQPSFLCGWHTQVTELWTSS